MAPLPRPSPGDDIQIRHSTLKASLQPRTEPSAPSLSHFSALVQRQNTIAIPASYSNLTGGPQPGTVAGIVLGSVAGFLLILWLIYSIFGQRSSSVSTASSVVVRERRKSTRASSGGRSRRHSETVEVRRAPPPPVVERVVMEERRERL